MLSSTANKLNIQRINGGHVPLARLHIAITLNSLNVEDSVLVGHPAMTKILLERNENIKLRTP